MKDTNHFNDIPDNLPVVDITGTPVTLKNPRKIIITNKYNGNISYGLIDEDKTIYLYSPVFESYRELFNELDFHLFNTYE